MVCQFWEGKAKIHDLYLQSGVASPLYLFYNSAPDIPYILNLLEIKVYYERTSFSV